MHCIISISLDDSITPFDPLSSKHNTFDHTAQIILYRYLIETEEHTWAKSVRKYMITQFTLIAIPSDISLSLRVGVVFFNTSTKTILRNQKFRYEH